MFFIAVLIQYPDLDRHLVKKQAWVTAQTMIALENWEMQGAAKHFFCILQSYPLAADKYISNMGRTMSREGNWYYTSFPPFSVICPYLTFKLLSIPISVANLQTFSLASHLIATIFVYMIVALVIPRSNRIHIPAIFACFLFIFMPTNMWTFANVYSWDIFCHPLWVVSIYLMMLSLRRIRDGRNGKFLFLTLGVVTFFMVYTEYLGLFAALSFCIFALYKGKASRRYKWVFYSVAAGTLLAFLVTIFQYSLINGIDSLVNYYSRKFHSVSVAGASLTGMRLLLYWYEISFSPAIILLAFLLVALILVGGVGKKRLRLSETEKQVIYFSLVPIIMHHAVFFSWTCTHYFGVLKWSLLVCITASILLSKNLACLRPERMLRFLSVLCIAVTVTGFYSVHLYKSAFAGGESSGHYIAGTYIREHCEPDETVFANWWPHPQEVFHSKRNIQKVASVDDAVEWLKRRGRTRGVIFFGRTTGTMKSIQEVTQYTKIRLTEGGGVTLDVHKESASV